MLPSVIVAIKELILWEYARLISEEAAGDRDNWLFTLHNFERLNSSKKLWPYILKEEVKIDPNKCVYCGGEDGLLITRIVPKKMCAAAEAHNSVRACKKCASSKGDKDLLEWTVFESYDRIPRGVMARYLKILYLCHECNGTVNGCAFDEDGNRSLVHLKHVLKKHCDPHKVKA